MDLFTIGYEGISADEFIEHLCQHRIDTVVDVRQRASSRNKDFCKTRLTGLLSSYGIGYIHIRTLGTPKAIRDKLKATRDYQSFFDEIEEVLKDRKVEIDSIIETLGSGNVVALLCMEKDHNKCHRSVVAKLVKSKSPNGISVMPIT